MTQPTITPAETAKRLRRMNFEQITGCAECDSCLFLRKDDAGGEPTASLADTSTGVVFTMKSADWLELCEKIRNGEIT